MAKGRALKRVFKLSLWGIGLLVYTAILIVWLHRASLDVVHQWRQPDEIAYDGMGPYYLSVIEGDLDWRGFPFYVDRRYFIYMGRDAGKPSHGHLIEFSFYPSYPDDLNTFLAKGEVRWTPEGAELVLPNGHRVFIPQDMFTGGR
ncbi:MAG: hypothetical protein IT441_06835 [Phycisphaeraceae bacterium]|nr:hypothetical protein [Phycisphaeraceae bacterium]